MAAASAPAGPGGGEAMLKAAKAKAKAGSAGRTSSHDAMADLPKSVLESSRQIWLAGLGAFSKAQGYSTVHSIQMR